MNFEGDPLAFADGNNNVNTTTVLKHIVGLSDKACRSLCTTTTATEPGKTLPTRNQPRNSTHYWNPSSSGDVPQCLSKESWHETQKYNVQVAGADNSRVMLYLYYYLRGSVENWTKYCL